MPQTKQIVSEKDDALIMIHFPVIVCAEAPTISKALLLSSSTNIGDTAQYSCDPGYRVANVTPITTEFQISCYLDNTKIAANWLDLPVCESNRTY